MIKHSQLPHYRGKTRCIISTPLEGQGRYPVAPIGSRKINPDGYIEVKVSPTQWRQEHRLVAEECIGRSLKGQECPHHINGDKQDNRKENLYLCSDWVEHQRVHHSFTPLKSNLIDRSYK